MRLGNKLRTLKISRQGLFYANMRKGIVKQCNWADLFLGPSELLEEIQHSVKEQEYAGEKWRVARVTMVNKRPRSFFKNRDDVVKVYIRDVHNEFVLANVYRDVGKSITDYIVMTLESRNLTEKMLKVSQSLIGKMSELIDQNMQQGLDEGKIDQATYDAFMAGKAVLDASSAAHLEDVKKSLLETNTRARSLKDAEQKGNE